MAIPIKKLSDHDLLVAAFTAAQTNQHPLAIKHFKEAIRRDPGDPFAYLEMAKSYFAIEDPEKSQQCLAKVSRFAKNEPHLLIALAGVYQTIRDYPKAIKAMQRAENIPELKITALTRQAELYESSNQLESANAALSKINSNEETAASHAINAKLLRRNGKLDQAQLILESLIEQTHDDQTEFTSSLQYELANVLDKQKKYQDAYQTLEAAKSHHTSTDAYNISQRGRRGVIARLNNLCQKIDTNTLAHWARQQKESTPRNSPTSTTVPQHCFLLGHPRSGTTLIEQSLDSHPQIQSADETAIFHNTAWMPSVLEHDKHTDTSYLDFLDTLPPNFIRRTRRNYQQHWLRSMGKEAPNHRVWLDKNPALTTRIAVIARFFPEAPVIFALRDPRDVILSAYMQPVGINDWSINWLTLEETVDYYCFAMQMWLDIRDKLDNPWIEIRYEDVVADFETQAKRATNHLGLEWNSSQLNIPEHVQKKIVFSPTYGDVARPIYQSSLNRWQHYREQIAPFEEKLQPFVQEFGYL